LGAHGGRATANGSPMGERGVRTTVQAYRRRAVHQGLGRMTKNTAEAVDTIVGISKGWLPFAGVPGEPWRWSEIVRLKPDLLAGI
jgi:hypothetical protein